MTTREPLHAVTWFVWALAAAACLQVASSPPYVALVIVFAALVVEAHDTGGLLGRAFPLLLLVGAVFGAVKIVLTVLTVHGSQGVLVTLPDLTLPTLLGGYTVGGTVESEVLAQSVADALVVVGVMGVFGAFNAVVSHDELVRSLPRTFHEPGTVLSVGLTFVPATIGSIRAMQESDRSRTGGRTVRRGRLVRLAVPLLESGMERAVSLSESMDSRGFARDQPTPRDTAAAWITLGSLVALGGVLIALVAGERDLALGLGGLAALSVGVAVATGSKGAARQRYRPRRLRPADGLVMVAATGAFAALVVIRATTSADLTWQVSPLRWPPIDVRVLLALSLLAVPALVPSRRRP